MQSPIKTGVKCVALIHVEENGRLNDSRLRENFITMHSINFILERRQPDEQGKKR